VFCAKGFAAFLAPVINGFNSLRCQPFNDLILIVRHAGIGQQKMINALAAFIQQRLVVVVGLGGIAFTPALSLREREIG